MSDRTLPPDDDLASQASLSEKPASGPMSVGAELASHRQARGWSVDQVASSLKLAPRQVEAIEADNHSMLPGIAVTRGFVRAYAKLLRIDATPLLAAMGAATEAILPSNRGAAAPFSDAKRSTFGKKRSNGKLVFGLLMLGGIALAALGFQQVGSLLPSIKQFGLKQSEMPSRDAPNSANTDSAASSSQNAAAIPPSQEATTEVTNEENIPPNESVTPDSAEMPVDTVASIKASDETASSANNLLQITINQDSWLEVRRVAGNEVLAARLVKAGTVETFEVDSPVKLTIGNVAGVEAMLRGEPMELKKAGGGGNVARLTIK